MNISIAQALDVWDDLHAALRGKASHGREAEIYAYRLRGDLPSRDLKRPLMAEIEEEIDAGNLAARDALASLCELFAKRHECSVMIGGHRGQGFVIPRGWAAQVGKKFDHRVMVEVKRRTKR